MKLSYALFAAFALSAAACSGAGGSSAGGAGDGTDGAGDGTGGGVGGAAGSSGACPAVTSWLFPPKQYGDHDLIRAIHVEGSDVYFRDGGTLYRAPAAGGAPVKIADAHFFGEGSFLVHGGKLVATDDDGHLLGVSLPGGQIAPVGPVVLAGLRNWSSHAPVLDATHAYWVSAKRPEFGSSEPVRYEIRRAPIAGGAPEVLYTAADDLGDLRLAGDALVFTQDAENGPTRVQRMPKTGGAPQGVQGDGTRVVGVAGDALFYAGTQGYLSWAFRSPVGGGAGEALVQVLAPDFVATPSTVYLGGVTTLVPAKDGKLPVTGHAVFAIPASGGAARTVACVEGGQYTFHAFAPAADGSVVYAALYESAKNVAGIARLAPVAR